MYSYEFTDNSIKLISDSDAPIFIKIVGIIAGCNLPDIDYFSFVLQSKGHWVIAKINMIGLSKLDVYINQQYNSSITLPNFLTKGYKGKNNIIGIGLNKTGTTSLRDSLSNNGFSVFDESYGHLNLLQDVHSGSILSTIAMLDYPKYEVYQDTPFSLRNVYKEIYKYRPNDFYLLTLRESTDEWVESAYKFYGHIIETMNNGKTYSKYFWNYKSTGISYKNFNHVYCILKNWGINNNTNIKEKLKYVYEKHNEECFNFFDSKLNVNFEALTVSKKNELNRLSKIIGFETNDNDFLWSNKSKS